MYDEISKDLSEKYKDMPRRRLPLWGEAIQELLKEKSDDPKNPLPISWLQHRTKIHAKTLHNIVKGHIVSPGDEKLVKIAEAFRISFPELASRAMGNISSNSSKIGYHEKGILSYPHLGFSIQMFSPPGITARDFSMGRMKIDPLRELKRWRFKANSKVCFHVYQGTIELTLDEKKKIYKFNEGDYFDAWIPHKWHNVDSKEAIIYLACYPALF